MLRHLIATVAALTAVAVLAPSAHAYTRFTFETERYVPARVTVESDDVHTRLELMRAGVVIKSTAADELDIGELVEGDVATVYFGQVPIASTTYEPLPVISDTVCIGHSSFYIRRAPGAVVLDAGAYKYGSSIGSDWTTGDSALVTLERPLQAGDVAYVLTSQVTAGVEIRSHRALRVPECPSPKPPSDPPVVAPPPITPPPSGPTEQQSLAALKGSIGATGSSLRPLRLQRLAKRASVALPFAFPEPGTVTLELVAKGKAIGTGARQSAANGKVSVSVKLTPAGRKLLKRAKKTLKVTVKGAFTASRPNVSTQRTAVTVTLKR